jgi:lysophospholipase L1-like esterase
MTKKEVTAAGGYYKKTAADREEGGGLTDESTEEEEEGEEVELREHSVSAVVLCEPFDGEPPALQPPQEIPGVGGGRGVARSLLAPCCRRRRRPWLLLLALFAVLVLVLVVLVAVPEGGRVNNNNNNNGNPAGIGAPAPDDPIVTPIPRTDWPDTVCTDNGWDIAGDADLEEFLDRFRAGNYAPECYRDVGDDGCRCPNPVAGSMPPDSGWWNETWQESNEVNRQRVRQAVDEGRRLDVILLGDSITEHWHGTDLGSTAPNFEGNLEVYREFFDSENSTLQGLALGNGGDRTPQLLYRVQTGGEIDPLEAPVIWILIGTNDILGEFCGPDEVVAGILSVAREVRNRKPSSTIVLQGLLPVLGGGGGLPLAPALYNEINQRIACYADLAPQMRFVNMTQSFLTANGTINRDLLVDGLHPGVEGSRVMGRRITRVVKDILGEESDGNRGLRSARGNRWL